MTKLKITYKKLAKGAKHREVAKATLIDGKTRTDVTDSWESVCNSHFPVVSKEPQYGTFGSYTVTYDLYGSQEDYKQLKTK